MNLQKLFKTQAQLDEHIYTKHPELRGQDNLDWKILALQVELGECANEWRGFKKWSTNQEPRTEVKRICHVCIGKGSRVIRIVPEIEKENCLYCEATGWEENRNPLLEEYVDCLHFILSIGIELEFDQQESEYLHTHNIKVYTETHTITQFQRIYDSISEFGNDENQMSYEEVFLYFAGLAAHLGFTWEQIEAAYYAKNKINHARQEANY